MADTKQQVAVVDAAAVDAAAAAVTTTQVAGAHEQVAGEAPKPAAGGKRARTALSLHEKAVVKSFCEQKVGESKGRGELAPSQDQLRREIAAKFGWACGRSTLSKIVSMDWARLQQGALQNPNMKRQRRPLFPALETDLVKFIAAFLDAAGSEADAGLPAQPSDPAEALVDAGSAATDRARGTKAVLTEALILEEAQRLKQVHGIKDEQLVLSVGWLARFKHRHGIRLRKTAASSRSGDARPREGGDSRGALPPGATASIPGAVEAVNWNSVDPLLLASSSSMLDALHVVDNDSMAGGKGPSDVQAPSISSASSIERQKNNAVDARPSVDAVHDNFAELLASVASPSALCGLLSPSDAESGKGEPQWESILDKLPTEIRRLACHCGSSDLRSLAREDVKGLRIVIVGANSTVDAFIAAALVGDLGRVLCVESVQTSRELGARLADHYVRDILQYTAAADPVLEFVGADSSAPGLDRLRSTADIVLLNCSLQTSEPSRVQRALECASVLLKAGGELRFTAVCGARRLSADERTQPSLSLDATKEQLLRSPYYVDMCLLCQRLGQQVDIRTITRPLDPISSLVLGDGEIKLYRCDFRLFAVKDLESSYEDYGQVAIYTGGCCGNASAQPQSEIAYRLDDEFCFSRGDRVAVDGNTARLLRSSWLRGVITVEGDWGRHRGGFNRAGSLKALLAHPSTTKVDVSAPSGTGYRMNAADI